MESQRPCSVLPDWPSGLTAAVRYPLEHLTLRYVTSGVSPLAWIGAPG